MIVTISAETWKQLRVLFRAKRKPVKGRDLRLTMSRRTKDGSFLGALEADELIKCVTRNDDPFESTFVLTGRGEHTADYGEYELDWEAYKKRA